MFNETITMPLSGGAASSAPPRITPRDRTWFLTRLVSGEHSRFCEVAKITPGMAALMLERNTNNRPMSVPTALRYADVMKEGRWRLSPEAIAFSKGGNLIDGQHRLAGCVESGVPIQMAVWFGCEPDEFLVVDGGRKRSAADLVAVDGPDYGTWRASIARANMSLGGQMDGAPDAAKVRAEALDMAGDDMESALRAAGRAAKVCKAGAGGLAYYHIAKATKRRYTLDAFWDRLVDGADLPSKSPILRLREYLRANRTTGTNGARSTIQSAAAIILAWNAYINGASPKAFTWPHSTKLPEIM